jgi:colicin import membrane protein
MKPFPSASDKPAKSWKALGLALGMHGLLLAFLVIGVNWKRQADAPASVSAQVWTEMPIATLPVAPPPPKSEPKPEPKPQPKPKPDPKVEEEEKPDIVVKAQDKKKPPEKKVEPKKEEPKKVEPKKSEPKKEIPKENKDSKEAASNEEQRRKELDRLVATAQAGAPSTTGAAAAGAGNAKPDAEYGSKLRSLLKSNTVFASAQDIEGNPTVVFAVKLRPDCTIASVRLQKPSGLPTWDAAAERAIKRSDPFPALKDGTCPRDELTITQRPKD